MMKKNMNLLFKLNDRRQRLIEILKTKPPIIDTLLDSHDRKIANANLYLNELEKILNFLIATDAPIKIVNITNFNNRINSSNRYFIDFDGMFLKLACIGLFPNPNEWVLYMTPLKYL